MRALYAIFLFLFVGLSQAAVVNITTDLGAGSHYYPDDSVYIFANQTGTNYVMHARKIVVATGVVIRTSGGTAGYGGGGGGGGGDGYDATGSGGAANGSGSPVAGTKPSLGGTGNNSGGAGGKGGGPGGGAGGAGGTDANGSNGSKGADGTSATLTSDQLYDETSAGGGPGSGGGGGGGSGGNSYPGHDEEGAGGGGGGAGGPGGGPIELYAEQGIVILGELDGGRGGPGKPGGPGGGPSPSTPTRYGGGGGAGGVSGKGGAGGPSWSSGNYGGTGGKGGAGGPGSVILACYAGDIVNYGHIDGGYIKLFYGGDYINIERDGFVSYVDYDVTITTNTVTTNGGVCIVMTNTFTGAADPATFDFVTVTNQWDFDPPLTVETTIESFSTTGAVSHATQFVFTVTYTNTYTNAAAVQGYTNVLDLVVDMTNTTPVDVTNTVCFEVWTDFTEINMTYTTNSTYVTNATLGTVSGAVEVIYKKVTNYHPSDRVRESTGGRGSRNVRMREPWF